MTAPPAVVGTDITWGAAADGSGTNLWYRFRARRFGGDYQVIRDYAPVYSLDWAAIREGIYEMEVSVRDLESGDVSAATSMFEVTSAVVNGQPAVNPTANPLVFLFSSPACEAGQRIQVVFQSAGSGVHQTPYANCAAGVSMNFYLAGMYENTSYTAHAIIDTGSEFQKGPDVTFTTGSVPAGMFAETVIHEPPVNASNPILLGTSSSMGAVATDLSGRVLWCAPDGIVSFIARPEPGGFFWGFVEDSSDGPSTEAIRKFDLTGTIVLETNAARVNEQLQSLGKRPISGFHHEVRTLPDGRVVALASVEQLLSGVQGPGPVDVLGDMIIVFDHNLNVVWTWDSFDHLDVSRQAVLGETCLANGGCPPYFLANDANDWTHGNAVQQTPDGALLYSSRHQDWLIKIDYNNGEGDGHVIWRLGKDGDFQYLTSDTYPWFSHQHDGNFLFSDPSTLLVYDDGNTRVAQLNQGHSRGQVLELDEQNRTATLRVNADLGVRSLAVGSAQRLRDGNYHFDSGYVLDEDNSAVAYSSEVDQSGNIVYDAEANTILYRSFRMTDMYTPD